MTISRLCTLLVISATVLISAVDRVDGQTKYGVSVKTVKPAALAKIKTYTWKASTPAPDKRVDAMIVAAVDRELSTRGLTKLASGTGDVLVTYASVQRTDVDLKKAEKNGALPEFSVGTLVVDLSDPKEEVLFRVRMDTPFDRDRATIEATINQVVAEMFAKYPAPKR
jgi:Domain of unknown function (DUF4136)